MVFAGCQGGGHAMPDAPVVGTTDGSQQSLGLSVTWDAQPALPGTVSDKLTVSSASFQVNHFQVVADSGNAIRSRYLLEWRQGVAPAQEMFPDATAGVYSKVSLATGGTLVDYAYEIQGTWSDGKVTKQFKIEDDLPITIQLDCDLVLSGAGSAAIAIRVNLGDPLNVIDFKDVIDDPIEISPTSNLLLLQAFRDRLPHGFKTDD
jgi:hypothetical protein